jgi:hypothetical protein
VEQNCSRRCQGKASDLILLIPWFSLTGYSLHIVEARVESQASSCRLFVYRNGSGTGFLKVILIPPPVSTTPYVRSVHILFTYYQHYLSLAANSIL